MATQSAIIWPLEFTPGETDNYVSNEVIAKGITAVQIWALLDNIKKWESYYLNCGQITAPESGPMLKKGDVFRFATFGFPPLTCSVKESVMPGPGTAGRLAWSADAGEGGAVYHAWLVEDLEGSRVRILTQESQIGSIFREWAGAVPNKMLLGHQDWLDGLVKAVRGQEVSETNLKSVGFSPRS
ncbi:hypothetical protein KVR01_001987 [Diaporthe batatas]|uniref:uncharacterized protein n=1 Tax=Diaporthe batatas TaxID=748121 RepID=UPI001D042FFC|nr:uncharacterized protein KVR01_001987 [Diaporthe batatas]KAG8169238.1 hypothetical protein KVR01_001987 [Diaporthe batatas]